MPVGAGPLRVWVVLEPDPSEDAVLVVCTPERSAPSFTKRQRVDAQRRRSFDRALSLPHSLLSCTCAQHGLAHRTGALTRDLIKHVFAQFVLLALPWENTRVVYHSSV